MNKEYKESQRQQNILEKYAAIFLKQRYYYNINVRIKI